MTGSVKVIGGDTKEFDTEVPESVEVARETFNREVGTMHGMAFDASTKEPLEGPYDPETTPEVIITRQFQGG